MTDAEKLEQAAARYKAGRDREFPCHRKVAKKERMPSVWEAHKAKVDEKRLQKLMEECNGNS